MNLALHHCVSTEARIYDTPEALATLEPYWRDLAARAGAAPFQSVDWTLALVTAFTDPAEGRPAVAALWEEGELVAVLPLQVRLVKGVKLLEWLGGAVTDHADAVVEVNALKDERLLQLWKAAGRLIDYDVALLRDVAPSARCRPLMTAHLHNLGSQMSAPYLTFAEGEVGRAGGRKLHSEARRNSKRLADRGPVTWRPVAPGAASHQVVEWLVCHKARQLEHMGLTNPIVTPGGHAFLHELVDRLPEVVRLFELCVGELRVAGNLAFSNPPVMHGYMCAYDPQFAAFSPGLVERASFLSWLPTEGYRELDLMRGSNRYKLHLAEGVRVLDDFAVARTVRGHAALVGFRTLRRFSRDEAAPDDGRIADE